METQGNSQSSSWIELYWLSKLQASQGCGKIISLISVACALAFLAILGYSMQQVEAKVKAMPYFQIDYQSLKINDLPEWLLPFTKEIAPIRLAPIPTIFTPDVAPKIAKAYSRNPWVKAVKEVVKKYPNHIYVQLALRRPIALIKVDECYAPADIDGVCLPGSYEDPEEIGYFLPVLEGVEEDLPNPGWKWKNPEVGESLKIISFLLKNGIFEIVPVKTIRIEKMPKFSYKVLTLIVEDKMRIIWGCLSISEFFISIQQRLASLKELAVLLSQQENFQKMIEVDLRFGYIIIREDDPIFPN